jgi:hypothetical protein
MKITTIVCATAIAIVVASLNLSPELAPKAWAQTEPAAATETTLEPVIALAVTARGAWSPSINYVKDDLVTSRGSAWRAKRANINKVPGSTLPSTALDWERFAAGFNPLGAWLSNKTYHRDDLVLRQGSTWRALRTGLNKTPGLFPADWQQFAAVGAAGGNSVADGSAGAPSINFSSDPTTGIFSPSAGKIAMTAGGALFLHNIGTNNTAVGASALDSNTSGSANTAMGIAALGGNSTGGSNTAFGSFALADNSVGGENTALGALALSLSTGSNNTAVGSDALASNTTAGFNTAVGRKALSSTTTAGNNTAVGSSALTANTIGGFNTAVGFNALASNIGGDNNVAMGASALTASTGNRNVAVGDNALLSNTTGTNNVGLGQGALSGNTTALANTGIGRDALLANTTGANNIALGGFAGRHPTTPSNSIFIGNEGVAADTLTIKIGTTQATTFIAGIVGKTTAVADAIPVLIDSAGQLGTVSSSRRYKEDIQPMGDASGALLKLRPVTFRYKQPYADGGKPIQYGLIAEEVAEVLPDLAVFNKDGSPETVKYHLLPALLLNEYQGQQRTIERQETTIRIQAEQIAALERRLSSLEAALPRPGSTAGIIRPTSFTRAAP